MEHAVLFNRSRWPHAQRGLPGGLAAAIRDEALEIANVLPAGPAGAYLNAAERRLTGFRSLVREALAKSPEPAFWPDPDADPARLAIWVFGLAWFASN